MFYRCKKIFLSVTKGVTLLQEAQGQVQESMTITQYSWTDGAFVIVNICVSLLLIFHHICGQHIISENGAYNIKHLKIWILCENVSWMYVLVDGQANYHFCGPSRNTFYVKATQFKVHNETCLESYEKISRWVGSLPKKKTFRVWGHWGT